VEDKVGASDAESQCSDDRLGSSEEASECVDDETLHQLPEPDIVFKGCGLSDLESDTTDVEREPSEPRFDLLTFGTLAAAAASEVVGRVCGSDKRIREPGTWQMLEACYRS
jgi:hypothetical protein